jgi:hypothetical protein
MDEEFFTIFGVNWDELRACCLLGTAHSIHDMRSVSNPTTLRKTRSMGTQEAMHLREHKRMPIARRTEQ